MTTDPSDPQPDNVRKPLFDWSDRDQRVLLGLALLVVIAIGAAYLRWLWRGQSLVEIERLPERQYDFRIDINRASWIEWMQLEGIGEVLARRIEADRKERGPFTSIDDVGRVPGIGTSKLVIIRPWLVCPDCKVGTTH